MILKGFYCKDGVTRSFTIGNKPQDPVFTIPDLLIHLSAEIQSKPANSVIKGEQMNVLGCSSSFDESVGLTDNFYNYLKEYTGIDA